jgi:hypothetical protein
MSDRRHRWDSGEHNKNIPRRPDTSGFR